MDRQLMSVDAPRGLCERGEEGEAGYRQRKVTHWGKYVAGGFGVLAGLASPVPRCGNPSVRLATQNVVLIASLLLWCLGATNLARTEALGIVGTLERTAEVCRQTCHNRWRPWCRAMADTRSARSSSSLSCDAASAS
jgi:hypothetical protein